jgi:hypothetical protein
MVLVLTTAVRLQISPLGPMRFTQLPDYRFDIYTGVPKQVKGKVVPVLN